MIGESLADYQARVVEAAVARLIYLRDVAEALSLKQRDAIEQACCRFIEECVRIRAVEAALTGRHAETYRDESGAFRWRDCECSVRCDHREDEHGDD